MDHRREWPRGMCWILWRMWVKSIFRCWENVPYIEIIAWQTTMLFGWAAIVQKTSAKLIHFAWCLIKYIHFYLSYSDLVLHHNVIMALKLMSLNPQTFQLTEKQIEQAEERSNKQVDLACCNFDDDTGLMACMLNSPFLFSLRRWN